MDREFAQGFYFNEPTKKQRNVAPDLFGTLGIRCGEAISWLCKQRQDEDGVVKLDIMRSRKGKCYLQKPFVKDRKLPRGIPTTAEQWQDHADAHKAIKRKLKTGEWDFYRDVSEAEMNTNIPAMEIISCCRKDSPKCKFVWEFA